MQPGRSAGQSSPQPPTVPGSPPPRRRRRRAAPCERRGSGRWERRRPAEHDMVAAFLDFLRREVLPRRMTAPFTPRVADDWCSLPRPARNQGTARAEEGEDLDQGAPGRSASPDLRRSADRHASARRQRRVLDHLARGGAAQFAIQAWSPEQPQGALRRRVVMSPARGDHQSPGRTCLAKALARQLGAFRQRRRPGGARPSRPREPRPGSPGIGSSLPRNSVRKQRIGVVKAVATRHQIAVRCIGAAGRRDDPALGEAGAGRRRASPRIPRDGARSRPPR